MQAGGQGFESPHLHEVMKRVHGLHKSQRVENLFSEAHEFYEGTVFEEYRDGARTRSVSAESMYKEVAKSNFLMTLLYLENCI